MNFKSIFKRETRVIAIAIICTAIVLLSGSYALFIKISKSKGTQVVEAGSLTITYENGNVVDLTSLSLDEENCLSPKADGDGKVGCTFTFTVKNRGTLPMNYNITMFNDPTRPAGTDFVSHDNIKHTLIRETLDSSGSVSTTAPVNTPATILGTFKTDSDGKRIIEENAVIGAEQSVKYTLYVWLSESSPESVSGQYVYLKYGVSGVVEGS